MMSLTEFEKLGGTAKGIWHGRFVATRIVLTFFAHESPADGIIFARVEKVAVGIESAEPHAVGMPREQTAFVPDQIFLAENCRFFSEQRDGLLLANAVHDAL